MWESKPWESSKRKRMRGVLMRKVLQTYRGSQTCSKQWGHQKSSMIVWGPYNIKEKMLIRYLMRRFSKSKKGWPKLRRFRSSFRVLIGKKQQMTSIWGFLNKRWWKMKNSPKESKWLSKLRKPSTNSPKKTLKNFRFLKLQTPNLNLSQNIMLSKQPTFIKCLKKAQNTYNNAFTCLYNLNIHARTSWKIPILAQTTKCFLGRWKNLMMKYTRGCFSWRG